MTTTSHTHRDRPTQLRLPGQAAAPEGPVDMLMMYVMHHAFRRDLDAFAAAVHHTPSADRRTWAALAARWALFADVLHHHHRGEDTGVWPHLRAHADEAERAVLDAMEAEHDEIDPVLDACAAGFTRLAEHDDEDARAALEVRVAAARASLGRHLHHEETEAIPLLQRVMTQADWERIEKEHFQPEDRGLRQVLAMVPWAAYGIAPEHHRRVFGSIGRTFWVAWVLTRGRFARRERRTFRYVPV